MKVSSSETSSGWCSKIAFSQKVADKRWDEWKAAKEQKVQAKQNLFNEGLEAGAISAEAKVNTESRSYCKEAEAAARLLKLLLVLKRSNLPRPLQKLLPRSPLLRLPRRAPAEETAEPVAEA